jgi:hypothetical protein
MKLARYSNMTGNVCLSEDVDKLEDKFEALQKEYEQLKSSIGYLELNSGTYTVEDFKNIDDKIHLSIVGPLEKRICMILTHPGVKEI